MSKKKKKSFSYLLAVGRRPRGLIVMVSVWGMCVCVCVCVGGGPIESVYVRIVHVRALSYKSVNFLF